MSKITEKQKIHVKTGDTVVVISGKDKGKVGKVKEVFPKTGKILVEGNEIGRHCLLPKFFLF